MKKQYLTAFQEDDFWAAVGVLENYGSLDNSREYLIIRTHLQQDDRGLFYEVDDDEQ